MEYFKRFFGNKYIGMLIGSLALTALGMFFDEMRDEMRDEEIIDETAENIIKRLEKEGYIKKNKK